MKTKLLFPFLVLLIGCTTGNRPLNEVQKEAVRKEAASVVKGFYDALSVSDTAKLMSFFKFDTELVSVGTIGISTADEIRKTAREYLTLVEKQTFVTKDEKYSVIDASCFVYTWRGKNGVYIKGSEPVIYDDLVGSYTFKKTKGEWKLVHLHESLVTPVILDPVKDFTKIEEDWGTAMLNKDMKALESLYADEYMYISSKGKIYNKQQDISEITGPTYKVLAPFKLSDINVKVYGSIVIVTGVTTSQSILAGKDISGSHNFMDIFTYRDGRWQCILSQSMPKPQ